jgi:hypothetical protein
MKALPWIIAGISIGAGFSLMLFTEPKPQLTAGPTETEDPIDDGIDDEIETRVEGSIGLPTRRTYGWAAKTRIGSRLSSNSGGFKQRVGRSMHERYSY